MLKSIAKTLIYVGIILVILSQYNFLYNLATTYLPKKTASLSKKASQAPSQAPSQAQTQPQPEVRESFYNYSRRRKSLNRPSGSFPFGKMKFSL